MFWFLMRTTMHSVNIADLKNNLSRYLEQVKAGKEIIVRDRNLAVARLVPMNAVVSRDEELARLAAQGKIRLGEGAVDDRYWKLRLPRVKQVRRARKDVLQWLIDEERNGR
jgi:prevent-host-death family protein